MEPCDVRGVEERDESETRKRLVHLQDHFDLNLTDTHLQSNGEHESSLLLESKYINMDSVIEHN